MKKKNSSPFFIASEHPAYPAGKGITRQFIGYDDSIMTLKVIFEQGARGDIHEHPHSQTTYIVSGVFEFTIDGETKLLKPGDGCYLAPNQSHGCICLEKGALIDTFSPVREDFLAQLVNKPKKA